MQSFDFEGLFVRFRYPLLILLTGLILILSGVFIVKSGLISSSTKVDVLQATTSGQAGGEITVEAAGEVMKPGVYKLPGGSRVEDLLIISGGFTAAADRNWTDKYLNRAAKLTDGQKVFTPSVNQQSSVLSAKNGGDDQSASSVISSDSNIKINVNTASLTQLDSLPGIGPVYGQSIIEHRPYSNVEELQSKGALRPSVYQKIKGLVSVY
jgi:competence protein ComEA